jgi:hypothetical protein
MLAPLNVPEGLCRVTLLDHKRDGLSDVAVAALYGTAPTIIAVLRTQFGVPAIAKDLGIKAPASKVPDMSREGKRKPNGRPIGQGQMTRDRGVDFEDPHRTSDEAEAHFRTFFATHPDFSHDDVMVKPMRRMPASVSTIVGCGGSSLSDVA